MYDKDLMHKILLATFNIQLDNKKNIELEDYINLE